MTRREALSRAVGCLAAFATICLALSCASQPQSAPTPTPTPAPAAFADILAQADNLYAQREELPRVREALKFLRLAHAADLRSFEATWRLSKFNYYLGTHATDTQERDAAFRDGIEAGRAAVETEPNRPEGHFWLGANLGGQARAQGALLGMSGVSEIRSEMQTVIRLDEAYLSGSAYAALGELELALPELLGGDRRRAIEYLEKGLNFGKNNARLRLTLARAYLADKREGDARQQLEAILALTPHPDFLPEYRETSAEARRLLEKHR